MQNDEADGRARDANISSWGVPADSEDSLRRSWGSGRRLPPASVDLLLDNGDALPITGRRLEVVHTPGHTEGHVCLIDETDGLIFTGDHVLPTRTRASDSVAARARTPSPTISSRPRG